MTSIQLTNDQICLLESKLCLSSEEIISQLTGWDVSQELFDAVLSLFLEYLEIEFDTILYDSIYLENNFKKIFNVLDFSEDTESSESMIFDYFYIIMGLVSSYKLGGIRGVLKNYSPELGGPRVYLYKCISNCDELNSLSINEPIYRGMSEEEYQSGIYGQFWSFDKTVAERFAQDTEDKIKVLVQANLKKEDVLLYRGNSMDYNPEKEVVIMLGAFSKNDIIKIDKIG